MGFRYVANDYPFDAFVQVVGGTPRWMPTSYGSLAINGWEAAALGGALPAFNFRFATRDSPGNYTVASVAGQAADSTVFTSDGSANGFGYFGGWGVVDVVAGPLTSGAIVMSDADGSAIPYVVAPGNFPLGIIFGYGTPGSAVNVWLFV